MLRRIVAVTIALVAIAVAVGLAVAWEDGYRLYAVRTGSMTPAFPTGAMVIDAPAPASISPGDVLTFSTDDGARLTTHRVVKVDGLWLETKGDANSTPDPAPVARSTVVGKVVRSVAAGGYVLVFCKQPAGVASLLTLLVALMLLHGLFFPSASKPRHARPRQRGLSGAAEYVLRLRARLTGHGPRQPESSADSPHATTSRFVPSP
jgi:signal peptidase I